MGTPRTIGGLALAVAGVGMLLGAAAGLTAMGHRDEASGFSATLAPVRSSGYAVVVPDLAGVVERHPTAGLLDASRIRITVKSGGGPLLVAAAPAADARRYLDGVARTELVGVGFAAGAQPVELLDIPGTAAPALPTQQSFWAVATAGRTIDWTDVGGRPTSLVLMRADGNPGIDATLTVGLYGGWLDGATRGLLLGGIVALVAGGALLFWPARPRPEPEPDPYRLADLAEEIAVRLAATRSYRALTGELVPVPSARSEERESPYVYTAT